MKIVDIAELHKSIEIARYALVHIEAKLECADVNIAGKALTKAAHIMNKILDEVSRQKKQRRKQVRKWTSELPKEPGWYFYQRTDGDFPVRVGYVFRARLPVFGMCVSLYYPKAEEEVIGTYLQDLTTPHRWAGPIPEPVEPEE